MALRLIEGFDDGLMAQKGWQTAYTGFSLPSTVTGRFGGKAIKDSGYYGVAYTLPSTLGGTVIVGMAVMPDSVSTRCMFFSFSDTQLQLIAEVGGALTLANTSYSQSFTTTTAVWPTVNIWRYIEVKYNTSTGETEVRAEGVTVLTATLSGAQAVSKIIFQYPNKIVSSTMSVYIDDVYVADTTGTRNNDFLGDVRVNLLVPTADGTHRDMAPSTGTTHYNLVNEATPDTTSYVSSPTSGAKETYKFTSLGANTGGVFGLRVTSYAHKGGTGVANIKNLVYINGADYAGTNTTPLSVSWTATSELWESNPATSAQWEAADINGGEFGVTTT